MYQVTEKSTVHGVKTPHGYKTPHKFPVPVGKDTFTDLLSTLVTSLYPTGRAFYMPKWGVSYLTHLAFNVSFVRFFSDCKSTLDSAFPDNENFNKDDCSLWEYRFGITTNENLSVEVRRDAVLRRMSRGANVQARQHKNYLEYQLRKAGFDVYVHQNGVVVNGEIVYTTPNEILLSSATSIQHGGSSQHGIGVQHGGGGSSVIANSEVEGELYSVSEENLWATFFIGGENLGEIASIPEKRQREFRELVLKLKPAHLVAFIFINYV